MRRTCIALALETARTGALKVPPRRVTLFDMSGVQQPFDWFAAQAVRTVAFSAAFAGPRERRGWTPIGVYSVALGADVLAGVLLAAGVLRSLEQPLSVVAAIVAVVWSAGWCFVLVYLRRTTRDIG
jgi:hypothetical protein